MAKDVQKQTILVNGADMDVTGWPKVAIDALLKSEQERADATAAAAAKSSRAIGYAIGPSGTLVMTSVSSRGLALYGGQWDKVIAEVTSGRLQAALTVNAPHLATRDANGRPVAPTQPKANYGRKDAGSQEVPAPAQSLADKAAAAAAATMAARDAAEASK